MTKLMLVVGALSLVGSAPLIAAPCKDAHGKFVKCPMLKVAAKPKTCRNASGHFTKCAAANHHA